MEKEELVEKLWNVINVKYDENRSEWTMEVNHKLLSKVLNMPNILRGVKTLPPNKGIDNVKKSIIENILKSIFDVDNKKRISANTYPGVLAFEEARNLYYPEIPSYRGYTEFFERMLDSIPLFYKDSKNNIKYTGISLYIDEKISKRVRKKLQILWNSKIVIKGSEINKGEIIFESSIPETSYFPVIQFLNMISYILYEKEEYLLGIQVFKSFGQKDKDKFSEFFVVKSSILKNFLSEDDNFSWIVKFCIDSYNASSKDDKKLIRGYIDTLSETLLKYEKIDYLLVRKIVNVLSKPIKKGNNVVFPLKYVRVTEVVEMERKEEAKAYFNKFYAIFSKIYEEIKEKVGEEKAKNTLKKIFYDLRNELNKDRFTRILVSRLGDFGISLSPEDISFESLNEFYLKSSLILNALVSVMER